MLSERELKIAMAVAKGMVNALIETSENTGWSPSEIRDAIFSDASWGQGLKDKLEELGGF